MQDRFANIRFLPAHLFSDASCFFALWLADSYDWWREWSFAAIAAEGVGYNDPITARGGMFFPEYRWLKNKNERITDGYLLFMISCALFTNFFNLKLYIYIYIFIIYLFSKFTMVHFRYSWIGNMFMSFISFFFLFPKYSLLNIGCYWICCNLLQLVRIGLFVCF